MPILIRPAQLQDVEDLAPIERAAETLFPAGLLPEPGHVIDISVLETAVEARHLQVAEVDGSVVGFALSNLLGEYLHLHEMSVHPDFGRRGIGRGLIEATKTSARDSGLPGVTLTTFSHIPWNGPFYERCGFVTLTEAQLTPDLTKILQQEDTDGYINRVAMLARLP
jgi:N-acetylglutamate synthase-like GNAT family acetyltransferase